jgi:hypothetical protein
VIIIVPMAMIAKQHHYATRFAACVFAVADGVGPGLLCLAGSPGRSHAGRRRANKRSRPIFDGMKLVAPQLTKGNDVRAHQLLSNEPPRPRARSRVCAVGIP